MPDHVKPRHIGRPERRRFGIAGQRARQVVNLLRTKRPVKEVGHDTGHGEDTDAVGNKIGGILA